MAQLTEGDRFPRLQAASLAHGTVTLPDDVPQGNWAVILAYRAHW